MASAKRILLLDGNVVSRQSLAEQLAQDGVYAVIEAGSAEDASAADDYQLAILDTDVAGSGALGEALRSAGKPVLYLTQSQEDGVGEQLVKPFRFAALAAKLAAHLGSARASNDRPVQIGPYQFRPGAKLLTEGARKVRLTEKETSILKFLADAGRTVPRETLLHEVWGYSPAVTTHTLETHIYRLRRKIEENPGRAKILITENGGYRLG